jgi:Fur family iron response transcriptional regulator
MFQNKYKRDGLADALRGHGINPTHQRVEIAHAIFSHGEHLSADQILARVNGRASETSKATVYNTLKLFVEKKLVREVIVDPSKVFYDPKQYSRHETAAAAARHEKSRRRYHRSDSLGSRLIQYSPLQRRWCSSAGRATDS